jgi:hypothetical protein
MAGVGDLVQRTEDDRTAQVLSGRAIERSDGAVCGLYHAREDEESWFLSSASKPKLMVCQWFGLKTTGTVFFSLASKPVATVFSGLVSKLVATVSPVLASKPVVGFLVEPQTQGGGGFPGLDLKTDSYSLVIWASKLSRLWFVGSATSHIFIFISKFVESELRIQFLFQKLNAGGRTVTSVFQSKPCLNCNEKI